ncbi:MAG: S46 family peptidase [Salinibacter sp.]|uniref:S46 family peptidase n=1 Tax=Salinibacter sp. TaxID=2065818 RepID=UPI002FC2C59B
MRTSAWHLIIILGMGGAFLAGCGGSGGTVSVPVVERPDETESSGDTLEATADEAVPMPSAYDTVRAQRFDRGRMWTFENLPTSYVRETHGFTPDEEWRTRAQRGALRFGSGCSASFVSAQGLVMTNHHCAREHITDVRRGEEALLEDGFYATDGGEERRAPNLYVDQLVETEDVTGTVYDGLREGRAAGAQARQQRVQSLQEKLTAEASSRDSSLRVEVTPLYRGARYTAYTYRRYEDVRLVMAPELQLGYFGGTEDNFTYPRYALDVAFFRVYAPDGEPLRPEHHFSWDEDGARPNESVFAVGHPGSTSRLDMVSQLEYQRDHELPNRLAALRSRGALLDTYIRSHPDSAAHYDLRNTYFSIENTIKGQTGQLRGLQEAYLLARRGAAVQALQDSIRAVDSLRQRYGKMVDRIGGLQQSKVVMADKAGAFATFANLELGSRILVRALHGYYYDFLRTRGAPPDRLEGIREDAEQVANWPPGLEKEFLVAQFEEVRSAYGADHPTVQRLFRTRTPEEVATRLVEESALMDSTRFLNLLDEGYRKSDDPSVPVIEALAPMFLNTNRQMQDVRASERTLNARLSRARVAVYGTTFPPDATRSLRLSDGRVRSYRYNGATAPPFTTFYGLYDRSFSHAGEAWRLPARWGTAVDSIDLGTPLNLVSTVDIAGGSSGSALLDEDLEVVGVVFDSNMEALPNEYLYRRQGARAVAVDARGILEALRTVYDADRLVEEITTDSPGG